MALPTSGSISFNQIKNEFNGTAPVRMSDYYRQGNRVKQGKKNEDVPTLGEISLSDFRGASRTTNVNIQIIGGGGAGGSSNNGLSQEHTKAEGGRDSSVNATGIIDLTAKGGSGGVNCHHYNLNYGPAGEASIYGSGGVQVGECTNGGDTPSDHYGAGGGGGGGDRSGYWGDSAGFSGQRGSAGTYKNVDHDIPYGTDLTIIVGEKGEGSGGGSYRWRGGHGAPGYCRLAYDGKPAVTFTSSGTHTVD